jgi:hypothetical protein
MAYENYTLKQVFVYSSHVESKEEILANFRIRQFQMQEGIHS